MWAESSRGSNEYKSRILKEADACTEPGEIGALLRREGVYSLYLSRWRREQDGGLLSRFEYELSHNH